ncbi:50S ribosomal protein L11 methyltransferase [Aerococcus kribbianus]|uniref:Ribosomal protein L11 methyltransferase n=1 Tax=Aerococcus kribbianus TaxID=2999064 RepID=A0A9X3FM66_9LACT|nr:MULTISPECIES: 50S ribosomal protein L11 methyltransferase [unclassified Aerococcus]MCZ0716935.1 50S ribosomal protein L11 methyltransferase [Aerococcus sp. YH-aer221]MCZ0725223.1 50S ribosomal protein L11 methyltransferase [Aerococcus sp. YH-aer222]
MDWIELWIETDHQAVEMISEYLWLLGSTGVSIKDKSDFTQLPDDGYGTIIGDLPEDDYADHPLVLGYFAEDAAMDGIIAELQDYITTYNQSLTDDPITVYTMRYEKIQSDEWENKWKDYYHPIQISRYLSIVPVWEDYLPNIDLETCIYLDPGMAFGTGSHPTTALILLLMEASIRQGMKVIDVGTGSGILAIAAKKLGAESVDAYEYDESVITTAKANIQLNTDMDQVNVAYNDKLTGITKQVDLITANILADILLPLIPQAYANLKAQGILLLSGIYYDQLDTIKVALNDQNFQVDLLIQKGDWYAIKAIKGA